MAAITIGELMSAQAMPAAGVPLGEVARPSTRWQDRYAVPDWRARLTKLDPKEEIAFRQWAAQTGAPITDDYDMRGFWKSGGATQVNPNDGLPHYTDTFKTPLHKTFSGESRYARPKSGAPMWNERDQLVLPNGQVIFDERAQ